MLTIDMQTARRCPGYLTVSVRLFSVKRFFHSLKFADLLYYM